jgi:hypothetical protein
MTITISTSELVFDFSQAAMLAGISIPIGDIVIEQWPAPHCPPTILPRGLQAIYVFLYSGQCLKVGKVGAKSSARYCSQHYGVGRAPSTLAKSLIKHQSRLGLTHLDVSCVADWIRKNTDRVNFLFPAKYGPLALSLFEAFVQCRLKPLLEGYESQLS